jgi:hypothetical protein
LALCRRIFGRAALLDVFVGDRRGGAQRVRHVPVVAIEQARQDARRVARGLTATETLEVLCGRIRAAMIEGVP